MGKRTAAARRVEQEPPGQEGELRSMREIDFAGGPLQLDGLIHERVRLGIVSALSVNQRLAFTELRDVLRTTDGNLSAHARRLEDAGYIDCIKMFDGRVPRTEYRLTERGRSELESYLDHMEALIRVTREG